MKEKVATKKKKKKPTYLCKLHLVHAFSSVPMQESLAPEHGCELLTDTLEELLDGSAVADEGGRHFQPTWGDVAHSGLHIVGDPLNEVRAVLVLDIEHLLIHLLHGHASTENGSHSQVATMTRITCCHHVLGIKHLLSQLWNGEGSVLLRATAGEWGKSRHEEMKTREGNHIYSQFAKISIQLTGESKASCHTTHGGGNKMVEVSVCWGSEFKGTEADIIESFVVNAVGFVCVFDKLVHREGSVVWLDYSIRNFRGWDYAESVHDSVRVFLTDLGDEEGTHTRASSTTKGVSKLETLKAVTTLCLLANNI